MLVHSGLGDCRTWDDQLPALSTRYRVLRYDQRGYGKSSAPPGPAWLHRDLSALLRVVGMTPAVVVGASLGGTTALDFTLDNPGMVRGLVLCGSGCSGRPRAEEIRRHGQDVDAIFATGGIGAAVEAEVRFWIDAGSSSIVYKKMLVSTKTSAVI